MIEAPTDRRTRRRIPNTDMHAPAAAHPQDGGGLVVTGRAQRIGPSLPSPAG